MIESWAFVEGDFRREYGIDLVGDLPRLTWRSFLTLVRALGPNSATATRQASRHYMGGGQAARVTRTPAESENVLASFFGRPAGKVN